MPRAGGSIARTNGSPRRARRALRRYYRRLYRHFGPQHWWPGRTRFEVVLGALLTQNTSWANVERAMANLRAAGLLAPKKLGQVPVAQLERLLRPAGYFRQKARYVAQFVRHLNGGNDGSVTRLLRGSTRKLRSELLALAGVGPETADCMLLYAGGRPVFVIDAYTRRVLSRHGLADAKAPYDALQDFFHGNLPRNGALFNEFHAQFVAVGKTFCHKRNPDCAACPLGPELERINARG